MVGMRNFAVACGAVLAAVAVGLWVLIAYGGLGLSRHGAIALSLGVLATVVLAMGLMGLVFASHRSGHDRRVHEDTERRLGRGADGE